MTIRFVDYIESQQDNTLHLFANTLRNSTVKKIF